MDPTLIAAPDPAQQRWAWWPLLPLYPYGRRRTLIRELVPDRIWSFEQLHGVWYVAVPIRMTVVRVDDGLLLYSPVPPTAEVVAELRALERRVGPVRAIVLASASGLEHKLPVPAMARAFPGATVWVTPHQWSFPLRLPASWLGFPPGRTKVLERDGLPYPDQLRWISLGPLDLGLGTFMEMACLDRASGSLLVTDALVSIGAEPPPLFDLDPTPLLFHARDGGREPLVDTPNHRRRGWQRIVLFANYFRPDCIEVPSLPALLAEMGGEGCRTARAHFGFYPFRWSPGWEAEAAHVCRDAESSCQARVAPVLERLVFPRAKEAFQAWLHQLAGHHEIQRLISAHYDAPVPLGPSQLLAYAADLEATPWARSEGPWQTLASIDQALLNLGVVRPAAR